MKPAGVEQVRFVAVTPAAAAKLRGDPKALAKLLEGERVETGLGEWWHGVAYLLAGRAKGIRGPVRWLVGGGQSLGRGARYLDPAKVSELAGALEETLPDDLGDGVYDLAAMDAAGVHPGRWEARGRSMDPLGTMRELYAYLREFLARQKRAKKGVVVVTTTAPADHLPDESDAGGEEPAAAGPDIAPPPDAGTEVLLVGANGRRYDRAQGPPTPESDATLQGLGYRPLGDMAVLPSLAGGVVRTYLSDDATSLAACVLDGARVSSTTFLAPLERDAVVLVSTSFVLDKVKRRLFAASLSRAGPAELDAALRERRATLVKKHGAPVALPRELGAAARLWEAWWAKLDGTH